MDGSGLDEFPPLTVNLGEAVLALAGALDMVGVDEVGHGQRVAVMADACAAELGWDPAGREALSRAALLHDCGVSSTRVHRHLINELEWSGSERHCILGAQYLENVPALADLAPVVRLHHTHWSEMRETGVAASLARPANLIFLVDRIDALVAGGHTDSLGALEIVGRHAETLFAPDFVEALRGAAASEAFWFSQEPRSLHEHARALVARGARGAALDMPDVKALAHMFGRIVDAKSPFTERHSLGVAALASRLGALAGLDRRACDVLELAGLFHDIGKLRVPDEILEKPARLDHGERRMMARHAFDSLEILREIFGEHPLCQWAAYHHEVLNGEGYPFRLGAGDLGLGARIVAVADVFQALAQRRPYREPLAPAAIAEILKALAEHDRLDAGVVDLARAHLDDCWRAAMAAEG